jgi:adenylate cyclase
MATARTERRLTAIMAADIVGYSRLIEADEAGTLSAIKELRREAIDPLLAEHHGRIVKLMGDGAIVEFGSVVDAVASAVAVQRAVTERQAGVPPGQRIVFRIGVNLGDVVIEGDGDLLGDGVNVAARLEQLCEPGGVAVSGTVYDHLQGKIDQPLDFAGEHRLKNIARPVRVYRLRTDRPAAGRRSWAARRLPGRPRRSRIAAALAVLSVLLVGGALALLPGAPGQKLWPALAGILGLPAGEDPRLGPNSIVVLPFDTVGGGPEHERLADGLTEDIIADLARYPDLAVIARNTAFTYKDRPVRTTDLGRELGVRYALEGSLQVAGDRVRVTAQLVDAGDDRHLWAERFDRPLADVFAHPPGLRGLRLGGRPGAAHGRVRGRHQARRRPRPQRPVDPGRGGDRLHPRERARTGPGRLRTGAGARAEQR